MTSSPFVYVYVWWLGDREWVLIKRNIVPQWTRIMTLRLISGGRQVLCLRGLSSLSSSGAVRDGDSVGSTSARAHVDFSNAQEAFKSKTTSELIKSYLIYSLFKYDSFVENSAKVKTDCRFRFYGDWVYISWIKWVIMHLATQVQCTTFYYCHR